MRTHTIPQQWQQQGRKRKDIDNRHILLELSVSKETWQKMKKKNVKRKFVPKAKIHTACNYCDTICVTRYNSAQVTNGKIFMIISIDLLISALTQKIIASIFNNILFCLFVWQNIRVARIFTTEIRLPHTHSHWNRHIDLYR